MKKFTCVLSIAIAGIVFCGCVADNANIAHPKKEESTLNSEKKTFKFEIVSFTDMGNPEVYPSGTKKIVFRSSFDGKEDWALFRAGDPSRNTVIFLHGSFSYADLIFTRKDVRNFWLKRVIDGNHNLLSINMRDTSYMSPAATADLTDLIDYCRINLNCDRIILLGGSGGASSAMAYACVHPEKINGVIAMGMCDIFARLDFARKSNIEVLQKLAKVTFESYGGSLEEKPELYKARSVLANINKLNMPIILTMGEADSLIPVVETRKIAEAMRDKKSFTYYEIPKGDHDSAVWVDIDLEKLKVIGYAPEDRLKQYK